MSGFEDSLAIASEKERTSSALQTASFWAGTAAITGLFFHTPFARSIDPATFLFTSLIVLCLWDEPVWNEPFGKLCAVLAGARDFWPVFLLPLFTANFWMAKDGSAPSAVVLAGAWVLMLRGRAERKYFWVFFPLLAFVLFWLTTVLAAALAVLVPFLKLVFSETVSRTKGRLDDRRKVWIPFAVLIGALLASLALTIPSK